MHEKINPKRAGKNPNALTYTHNQEGNLTNLSSNILSKIHPLTIYNAGKQHCLQPWMDSNHEQP